MTCHVVKIFLIKDISPMLNVIFLIKDISTMLNVMRKLFLNKEEGILHNETIV